jgi:hypothetical protein
MTGGRGTRSNKDEGLAMDKDTFISWCQDSAFKATILEAVSPRLTKLEEEYKVLNQNHGELKAAHEELCNRVKTLEGNMGNISQDVSQVKKDTRSNIEKVEVSSKMNNLIFAGIEEKQKRMLLIPLFNSQTADYKSK